MWKEGWGRAERAPSRGLPGIYFFWIPEKGNSVQCRNIFTLVCGNFVWFSLALWRSLNLFTPIQPVLLYLDLLDHVRGLF